MKRPFRVGDRVSTPNGRHGVVMPKASCASESCTHVRLDGDDDDVTLFQIHDLRRLVPKKKLALCEHSKPIVYRHCEWCPNCGAVYELGGTGWRLPARKVPR